MPAASLQQQNEPRVLNVLDQPDDDSTQGSNNQAQSNQKETDSRTNPDNQAKSTPSKPKNIKLTQTGPYLLSDAEKRRILLLTATAPELILMAHQEAVKKVKKAVTDISIRLLLRDNRLPQNEEEINKKSSNLPVLSAQKKQAMNLMCRIYIGSINFNVNEANIKAAFSPFGPVRAVNLSMDLATNRHKGFAFLEYENPEAAYLSLSQMNGVILGERNIKVGRPSNMPQAEPLINQLVEESKKFPRIYVSSIPTSINEEDLRQIFAVFGEITNLTLTPDPADASKHIGYAYIVYAEMSSADEAVKSMNLFNLMDQYLRVGKAVTPMFAENLHNEAVLNEATQMAQLITSKLKSIATLTQSQPTTTMLIEEEKAKKSRSRSRQTSRRRSRSSSRSRRRSTRDSTRRYRSRDLSRSHRSRERSSRHYRSSYERDERRRSRDRRDRKSSPSIDKRESSHRRDADGGGKTKDKSSKKSSRDRSGSRKRSEGRSSSSKKRSIDNRKDLKVSSPRQNIEKSEKKLPNGSNDSPVVNGSKINENYKYEPKKFKESNDKPSKSSKIGSPENKKSSTSSNSANHKHNSKSPKRESSQSSKNEKETQNDEDTKLKNGIPKDPQNDDSLHGTKNTKEQTLSPPPQDSNNLSRQEAVSLIRGAEERQLHMHRLARQIEQKTIVMANLASVEEIDEYFEADIEEECSKYAQVQKVVIYIQTNSDDEDYSEDNSKPKSEPEKKVYVFIECKTNACAKKLAEVMHNRFFGGKQISAKFYDQELFDQDHYRIYS